MPSLHACKILTRHARDDFVKICAYCLDGRCLLLERLNYLERVLEGVHNLVTNEPIYLAEVFDRTTGYFSMGSSLPEPRDMSASHRLV